MRLILVIAAALLLCTCHPSGNQTKSVSRQNSQPPPDVLSEADFYQIDSVMACQHRSGLVGALQGKKLFLKAIDLYRNQKNPEASIDLFHKSIRIWPDAKSYYELGDALIDLKDYQQSLHAFKVALNLQFEPLPNLYYNMACAHAMLHDTLEAVNYLQDALRNGYSNQKQVLSDTDLDAIRNTPGYRSAVLEHFKGNLTMRQLQFRSFLSSFPELTLPMNISKDSVGKYNLAKAISYDFAEFIPGMENQEFSRGVTSEYQAIGKKILPNGNILVSYSVIQTIVDTLVPVSTFVAVFDSSGVELDDHLLSCLCDPEKTVAGLLDANGNITSTEYQQKWKFNPDEKGFEGNSVVSQIQKEVKHFLLGASGTFTQQQEELPVSAKRN